VPYKDKEIEKVYWTIGEVAEMLQVSSSLLRFWEAEIGLVQPRKNRKGDRYYSRKDIELLKLIYHLVKEQGYTLKGAKQHLMSDRSSAEARFETISSLKRIREFLVQIREQL
jgi:DNA-binding transcriptional MerR regulator